MQIFVRTPVMGLDTIVECNQVNLLKPRPLSPVALSHRSCARKTLKVKFSFVKISDKA